MASALGYHIIKTYERELYASFVKADLVALLKSVSIERSQQRSALAGFARITVGRKEVR